MQGSFKRCAGRGPQVIIWAMRGSGSVSLASLQRRLDYRWILPLREKNDSSSVLWNANR